MFCFADAFAAFFLRFCCFTVASAASLLPFCFAAAFTAFAAAIDDGLAAAFDVAFADQLSKATAKAAAKPAAKPAAKAVA